MWIKLRTLTKSFRYARKGLAYTFRHEQNFRIQLLAAAGVIALMLVFGVKQWEAIALIFVICAVLFTELLNTVLERLVDILRPRLHHYSEIIKDMMAAAVFVTSFGALLVGIIIFYPYIARLLTENMV